MTVQSLLVGLIVGACAAQAAWTLMPAAARRALARQVLKLPLSPRLARPFRRAVGSEGACGGCGGCAGAHDDASTVKPLSVHRRGRRRQG